jgi:hypothetical protein
MLKPGCWQCELDIPHVCYSGMPNASWGMTDNAVAALEGFHRWRRGELSGMPAARVAEQAPRTRPRSKQFKRRRRS